MEAPYIFKRNGIYFLLYSTHWTNNETYDVQYATSKNIMGPYTRQKEPLLKSGTKYGCNLVGPGGASFQRFQASKGNTPADGVPCSRESGWRTYVLHGNCAR